MWGTTTKQRASRHYRVQWLAMLPLLLVAVEASPERRSPPSLSRAGLGRGLQAAPTVSEHLKSFMENWHIEDMPEVEQDDGQNRDRFFTTNFQQSIDQFNAEEVQKRDALATPARKRASGKPGGATKGQNAAGRHKLQPGRQDDHLEEQAAAAEDSQAKAGAQPKPTPKRKAEPQAVQDTSGADAGEVEQAAEKSAAARQPRKATAKKRRSKKLRGGTVVLPTQRPGADPLDGCKVHMLDLAPLAERQGLPACDLASLAAQPLTQRLLPDPRVADPAAAEELNKPPETLAWQFPYTAWPHNYSQHAAPWHFKQEVLRSGLHTANISEATVVLVDDYCYFSWAIADQRAQGHWWLDTHKHYKSDFKVGQHLLDLYHAMVHENSFIHKQGRNFLFMAPLTNYDFGDWKGLEDYTAMSCEHFSNSMHVVFDQVQRWRCGRYRPERTLVAPLSVADAASAPPQDAARPLTLTFRGSCTPDHSKEPVFAGKRLRSLLVRLFTNSGDDVSVSCTNEDKTGLGPAAVESHAILTHVDYMRELGRSKFCAIIPSETQNTPRVTEAFLAGCVPVFIGPPWHAMPFPEAVDYRAASIAVHMSDTSRWANFGTKWALEKNAPRDVSRTHPRWWTPQMSVKDMEEMQSLKDLVAFLRDYPEEQYQAKLAAVYKHRSFFEWAAHGDQHSVAAEHTLRTVCGWGQEETRVTHIDI